MPANMYRTRQARRGPRAYGFEDVKCKSRQELASLTRPLGISDIAVMIFVRGLSSRIVLLGRHRSLKARIGSKILAAALFGLQQP